MRHLLDDAIKLHTIGIALVEQQACQPMKMRGVALAYLKWYTHKFIVLLRVQVVIKCRAGVVLHERRLDAMKIVLEAIQPSELEISGQRDAEALYK